MALPPGPASKGGRGLGTRLDTPNAHQTYLQVTDCVNAKKTDVTLYMGNVSLDGEKCIELILHQTLIIATESLAS